MSEKNKKEPSSELLYISNPNCGWCKKADPLVKELVDDGYKIVTLDVSNEEQGKRASEAKAKHNASCGTPLFLDSVTGNQICGFKDKETIKKWADGEKIPPPPPRQPQRPQQPQQGVPQGAVDPVPRMEFAFSVWEAAKQTLMDKFYNEYEIWNNWNFEDGNMVGECPIKSRPQFPTSAQILIEAQKIFHFCSSK